MLTDMQILRSVELLMQRTQYGQVGNLVRKRKKEKRKKKKTTLTTVTKQKY